MLVVGEQRGQPLALLLGEQCGAGVQGAPRGMERVALAAAVPTGGLLDAAAALVRRTGAVADRRQVDDHAYRVD